MSGKQYMNTVNEPTQQINNRKCKHLTVGWGYSLCLAHFEILLFQQMFCDNLQLQYMQLCQ